MRPRAGALAILTVLAAASCGRSNADQPSTLKAVRLTVLAASSLTNVFPQIGEAFAHDHPRVAFDFSFGGTDALTAQIEQGAPADVFAGASTTYGDRLAGERLIDPYRAFCTNRLVVVVPSSNPAGIASLADLQRPGVKVVVGAETVPVGAYTRKVLSNLDATFGSDFDRKVLANVVSDEDSVEGVLTKVRLGEADAGFVYITDARAAGSDVKALDLPEAAQAVATYPIAAVRASTNLAMARRFVDYVLSPPAQALLRRAGFGPPPSSP